MRARTWGIVILVNAIISAAVVLIVLLVWRRPPASDTASPETATPAPATATVNALAASSTPAIASAAELPPADDVPALEPLTYVVQEGDTLSEIAANYDVSIEELMVANSLADPNLLQLGQTLIIPGAGGTAEPAAPATTLADATPAQAPIATPLPTPTSTGPPLVEIREVIAPGDVLSEIAVVGNSGGVADLGQWTLSDNQGNVFIFPSVTLFTDAEVRVHTRQGAHLPTDLYWGRTKAAWAAGELITLRDNTNALIDTFVIP